MVLDLSGIIDERLRGEVAELGAKPAIQLRMREEAVGKGVFTVPPVEVLGIDEVSSLRQRVGLNLECLRMGVWPKIIVRASEAGDWQGLTDVLTTKAKTSAQLNEHLRWLAEDLRDPQIARFAELEGNHYDPENAHVALSPYIPFDQVATITEHPNVDGTFVDFEAWFFGEAYDAASRHTPHYLPRSEENRPTTRGKVTQLEDALRVLRAVRETNWFSPDVALQLEVGFRYSDKRGKRGPLPVLLQIRELAKRQTADFEITEGEGKLVRQNAYNRTFGITSPEGIVLPVRCSSMSNSAIRRASKHPFLFQIDANSGELTREDINPELTGFVSSKNPALQHQNTRFVQHALRRDGVAFLQSRRDCARSDLIAFLRGDSARITSNGHTMAFQLLD